MGSRPTSSRYGSRVAFSVEAWAEVSQLFADACELPPPEWEAFLDFAGCSSGESRRQVLELLRAHGKETCAVDLLPLGGADLRNTAPLEPSGHLISGAGSYRILERIGEGGVGIVYRAHRLLDGAHQTVALKVIKPGMDTRRVLRRFERERQLLAALDHPNIARLIDLGATPEGRPSWSWSTSTRAH